LHPHKTTGTITVLHVSAVKLIIGHLLIASLSFDFPKTIRSSKRLDSCQQCWDLLQCPYSVLLWHMYRKGSHYA